MPATKKDPQVLLLIAVNAVMQEVGYVMKGGKVEFGSTRYKFAGEGDIIKALRPAMVEHGLMLVPTHARQSATSGSTKIVDVDYTLYHTGGGSIPVSAVGQGADKMDKAIPKAMTGAFKYAIRQAFMIETGDDPDRDASGKTAADIAEHERKEAHTKQCIERDQKVTDVGLKPRDVDGYMKSLDQPTVHDMSSQKFTALMKRLRSEDGKAKVTAWVEGQAGQDSTSRAADAIG